MKQREQNRIIDLQTELQKQPLMELLRQQGVYIPAYCGSKGTCGKCRVQFLTGAPEPGLEDRERFSEKELEKGWRLACKAKVSGEVQISIEESVMEENIIADAACDTKINIEDKNNKVENKNIDDIKYSDSEERKKQGKVSGQIPSHTVCIDIGTTTIAAIELNPHTGTIIQDAVTTNHQRAYGADVISRIQAANEGKGQLLQSILWEDIENLLNKMNIPLENSRLIISCNTTMGHLLQGYSCATLGKAPYEPVDISCHTFFYHGNDDILILPGISTFVGADIVSGIVETGMHKKEEITILVDVGTNGEIAIGNKDKILVTSAAAGPAFEGSNIDCGVAAVPGAISTVEIRDGRIFLGTIGEQKPVGICGSGVLEITYELLKNGYLDENGRLCEPYVQMGVPIFTANQYSEKSIKFTQKDIRQVQYAKSAIRTGIEILLKEYGITYDEVDHLYLAGGFGKHLNVEKAVGIGMLPAELKDKISAVGNTSLFGAMLVARDEAILEDFVNVAGMAEEITLAGHQNFQECYLEYMSFPQRDEK